MGLTSVNDMLSLLGPRGWAVSFVPEWDRSGAKGEVPETLYFQYSKNFAYRELMDPVAPTFGPAGLDFPTYLVTWSADELMARVAQHVCAEPRIAYSGTDGAVLWIDTLDDPEDPNVRGRIVLSTLVLPPGF